MLVFGARQALAAPDLWQQVRSLWPQAHVVTCSTAGEIFGSEVLDDSLVANAVHFNTTRVEFAEVNIAGAEESYEAGRRLAAALPSEGLVHVMVFSDGLKVNGTALARGLREHVPAGVCVTGGLVGDGTDFKQTLVGLDGPPTEGKIVVVGFYGSSLKVGFGSMGGWDPFGPPRVITRSKDNVLFELDNQPALDLYKKYLGDQAAGLPSTGLLFPLSLKIQTPEGEVELVRTLLGVNEEEQSMTFAGDMPEGVTVRLMKANFDRLIDGAENAASQSHQRLSSQADFAILVSCIGRKLILKERVEEEIEAVRSVLGETPVTGFYSYGEICPTAALQNQCQLHNQTMTITTLAERP
ncbi:MAG: FIST signal transduction protein [Candidatus Xenobia bacterium]